MHHYRNTFFIHRLSRQPCYQIKTNYEQDKEQYFSMKKKYKQLYDSGD